MSSIYRALSLGAGVQSSVLALRFAQQDPELLDLGYPPPDVALFADTQWEPQGIYRHLDWLETQLTFPLVRVTAGNLKANATAGVNLAGKPWLDIPIHFRDGSRKMMQRRQCTADYKIRPLYRALRKLAGGVPKRPFPKDITVEMYLGISFDEIQRMKPSRERWLTNRFPLVDLRMTRAQCRDWFAERYPGRSLARSACIVCPLHSAADWQHLRTHEPAAWREAVEFDAVLRDGHPSRGRIRGDMYLHHRCEPIEVAVAQDSDDSPPSLFDLECEGMCGV